MSVVSRPPLPFTGDLHRPSRPPPDGTPLASVTAPPVTRSEPAESRAAARPRHVHHPHARSLVKRWTDVFGGLVLLVLFVVLFPFVAFVIRLESRGAVIYRQTRVGLCGSSFTMYKFRTMRHDAESDGQARWAQQGDPRVTRCGRFLRATRLDEVPQAINVIRGEMSLVGPRPERPELIAALQARHSNFVQRQVIKPGLTGLAQVRHCYTSSMDDWSLKLAYDIEYVRRASHWMDLCILARTVRVVLGMRGT